MPDGRGGLEAIGEALDQAEPVERTPEDDGGGGGAGGPEPLLPAECPIQPLGMLGDVCFYLDALCQLTSLDPRGHSRNAIQRMFGVHHHLPREYWPRRKKFVDTEGNEIWTVTGWKPEDATDAMMASCARLGIFDPQERVRGRGCWVDSDGALVWHVGNAVLKGNAEAQRPGYVGRFVYPAAPTIPRPFDAHVMGGPKGPAQELLDLFGKWKWRRGIDDAHLLLGWCCAALIGGALKWRPVIWLTGDRGTGKSTLHDVIAAVFGGAMVHASDPSAAGIWQVLGMDTLPVAVDEAEPEVGNNRTRDVVRLARLAASGALMLRGSADHKAAKFMARSCFLFSSIHVAPLKPQDETRILVLDLEAPEKADPPAWRPDHMLELGRRLRRRMIQGWDRLPAALEQWRSSLASQGHDGRGCDLFGTILACADVALHDHEADGDTLQAWGDKLRVDRAEAARNSDQFRCLHHLLSTQIDPTRSGNRRTVASWALQAAGMRGDGVPYSQDHVEGQEIRDRAQAALQAFGMKVWAVGGIPCLCVANTHQGLALLYRDTHWQTAPGATAVWVSALRRLEGAVATGALRFNGVAIRSTAVPLTLCFGGSAVDDGA